MAGILACASAVLLLGCSEESERAIRAKLDIILADDLATVVAELPDSSVADSTSYEVVTFKAYAEGTYARMAVVNFRFLRKDIAIMVRKYRYHRQQRKWERYYNEYKYTHGASD